MANNRISKIIGIGILAGAVILAGCGGGEERQAEYLTRAQDYYDQENIEKAKIEVKNVLQINPKNADARYLLGLINEQSKNFRAAFQEFNVAVENDKGHIKALNKIASYYIASKDLEKGLEKINTALAIDTNNADALANQATVYVAQEKKDEAIETAQRVLSLEPGHVQATTILTALYAKDNPDLALKTITDAIANQSKSEALKLLKIRLLASQNKSEEVISQYKELISEHPDNLFYRAQLVNYHLQDKAKDEQERKGAAEKILRDLIVEKPEEDAPKQWLVEFLFKNRSQEQGRSQLEQFVKSDPENFKMRNQLASLYMANKEADKAKALYQYVIDDNPIGSESLAARNRLVAIALAEQDKSKAEALLEEIFAIEAENAEALITRARLKLADNDVDGAIPDLRVVLKNEPESVMALSLLASAHEKNNAPDLALDNYQRLLAVQPKNIGALLGTARLLISKNQLAEALPLLERANGINDRVPEVVRLLTDLYVREQRWDDALSTAAKLTENEQTMAMGYYLQGRTYLRKKDIKSAIDVLEKSHELEPRGIETLSALVSGYIALDQLEKAISYVVAHTKKYPDQIHAQEVLGNLYAHDGNMTLATEKFQSVIKQVPDKNSSYQALTRIYASQGKLDEIEALYLDGLEQKPDNLGLRLMLAELYQARGDHQQAVDTYEILLKAKPNALTVKNNLAVLLVDHFNTPANLTRATELAADLGATENPAFLDTAGWVQYQLGNYPQAVSLLDAAVENGGSAPEYHYHLGMAYFKSDMKTQAKEHLELALANEKVNFAGKEVAENTLKQL